MFGVERMTAALNTAPDGSPEEILSAVKQAVDAFVGEAEQFDDLTMMCLEYRGPDDSPGTSEQKKK
jgi:sigma-B regulation protein RsbU (phosphoserine phosphatase)